MLQPKDLIKSQHTTLLYLLLLFCNHINLLHFICCFEMTQLTHECFLILVTAMILFFPFHFFFNYIKKHHVRTCTL